MAARRNQRPFRRRQTEGKLLSGTKQKRSRDGMQHLTVGEKCDRALMLARTRIVVDRLVVTNVRGKRGEEDYKQAQQHTRKALRRGSKRRNGCLASHDECN